MATYGIGQRGRGSGVKMPGISGETIPRGSAVYMAAADGLWYLADANVAAALPAMGISTEGASVAGRRFQILVLGLMSRNNWAWTRGDPIYISNVAGVLTQTAPVAPSVSQQVAVAITATMIYVDVQDSGFGSAAGCPILEGSTAYVGFDDCKEPYTNYWYCDGAADEVQINLALAYVTGLGGGSVELEQGTYTIVDSITFTGDRLMLIGQGRDTFIDGDGLSTGEHAIVINSENDSVVRDLSIQTENGGGKTCHCIFINDSANRTLIENVTIVDSDDNGIHSEGISQGDTRILNCDILNADGHGIYVGMDAENLLYTLMVRDCAFTQVSGDGIHLNRTKNAQIFDNVFDTGIGGDGIELVDSDDCHIAHNIMSGVTGYDINISAASCDRTRVFHNILYGDGTACINDAGTGTILPTLKLQFVDGTAFLSSNAAAWGWEIDADTEYAIALGHLPLEVQQVVRWKVWATALVTEGDAMRLQIAGAGGASNEPYNTEAVAVVDKPSTTTNFTANDIIYWVFDASDDADIDDMLGGDAIQIKVLHEGAGNGDCETDAVFLCAEVEYV